jgi:DNA-binding transcriptional ArsR family regulator
MEETDESLALALKALGHPKRIRLLRFLTEPRTLEAIAGDLKVARQSAQEHVDRLVRMGLVAVRHGRGDHGPVTRYQVTVPRLFDIYDRLGTRLGLLASELEEDVRGNQPTAVLAARSSPKPLDAPRLIIVHGMRVGQTIPLQGDGPWLIGRDPAAALALDYDPYVSHRHAEIRRTRNGFELADALSSNGVAVDWHPVPRGGVVPLANGSLLRAGKTLVLFRIT